MLKISIRNPDKNYFYH